MTIESGLRAGREPISLSALEFDVVWKHLDLSEIPLILDVPSPGATWEERAKLEQQVWFDLEQRGLGRQVAIDPELEEILGILARPEREVDGRVWVGKITRFVVAAVRDHAVLAVLSDDQLTFHRVPITGLPGVAVGVLPPAPAGPGHSVSLRSDDFTAAANDANDVNSFKAGLVSAGLRPDDANTLATVFDAKLTGNGNFGVAARDKLSRRVRGNRVVAFFDTEAGRYVQLRKQAPDGTPWTTIAPADGAKLARHIDEVLTEVLREVED
ncbi:ESAT-6 protein secretion system EspG family protein [Herbihabitans rhizosphaerae]|uniref:ESAT-6 protein secretion system EspG family protein n=1 Tax=Herbihabitans rhizosphaerae TaxID=1872711 RepID=A0A4Q7KX97_9PSEU|nr:ESX secretion-associated protein EspG [Herbihabitans rhizosphaerae]RZS41355.1 ESAT-6 protein secretion system EspG family protein [Herbihabitans rhizosphaerae]